MVRHIHQKRKILASSEDHEFRMGNVNDIIIITLCQYRFACMLALCESSYDLKCGHDFHMPPQRASYGDSLENIEWNTRILRSY